MKLTRKHSEILSFRVPTDYKDKIRAIGNRYGGNQTTIILACIDAVYNTLDNKKRKEMQMKLEKLEKDKIVLQEMIDTQIELYKDMIQIQNPKEQIRIDI